MVIFKSLVCKYLKEIRNMKSDIILDNEELELLEELESDNFIDKLLSKDEITNRQFEK
jgi:hypothetical protein